MYSMKKFLLLICLMFPVLAMAQGNKGEVDDCVSMKDGKVYYADEEDIDGATQFEIFKTINAWAKKIYKTPINVRSNKGKGTININSKAELKLNDSEKANIKYKMRISCTDGHYTIEATDIEYQYTADPSIKPKTYKAEDVIANNGKSNTIAEIKNPKDFCNATYFFIESLFADVYSAAEEVENDD